MDIFRRFRLRRYKRKSIREVRSEGESLYRLNFSFSLSDISGEDHKIENLIIDVPSMSAYDVKSKLGEILIEKIEFDINSIEEIKQINND